MITKNRKGMLYMNVDKKTIVSGALVLALGVGIAVGSSLNVFQANAQTTTPSTIQTQNSQVKPNDNFDPAKGGHIGSNGKKEELLTGTAAEKVSAAASKAVAGGTIERVETDAEGSAYEAHMTKSDGSRVTVKLDSNFIVTSVNSRAR